MTEQTVLNSGFHKGKEVFIAESAVVIGNVILGDEVSIWFGAVLRGDGDKIEIGSRSNIQDNAVIHVDPGYPVKIGENCIIGHSAVVHGSELANNVLIGINATVLNGASIGDFSVIGAGSVIPEGMKIPPYSIVMGIPGKIVKSTDERMKEKIIRNAESYVVLSKKYLTS